MDEQIIKILVKKISEIKTENNQTNQLAITDTSRLYKNRAVGR